jgi:hypothetical protein
MNKQVALMASAGFGLAFLAACSDSSTAPKSSAFVPKANLAVGQLTNNTAEVTVLKICKLGNVGGTFVVTSTPSSFGTGTPEVQTPITVAAGECRVAANDLGNADLQHGDFFHVAENAAADPANTTQVLTSCIGIGQITIACNDQYFINTVHGTVLTYTNTFTPPATGCTFTKGWYRNNGSNTVTIVDGRSKADAQAIFNATPGKPGNVTWQGGNDVLNLYQQLLAALLNGGATGPAAVQAAITAAQAGTGGTGQNITTNLTQAQVSALIDTLSAFNEGTFAGFPHCD